MNSAMMDLAPTAASIGAAVARELGQGGEPESESELDALQRALNDPEATTVQVRRREGDWRYLTRYQASEFDSDVGELLDLIRRDHGGGQYELRVMRRGPGGRGTVFGAQRVTTVHGPPKRATDPAPPPAAVLQAPAPAAPASELADLLRAMDRRMEMMEARVAAAATAPAAPAPDPLSMLTSLASVFQMLQGQASGGSGDYREVRRAFEEGLALGQEIGGGGDHGPSIIEQAGPVVEKLVTIATRDHELKAQEMEMRRLSFRNNNRPAPPAAATATPAGAGQQRAPAWLVLAVPYLPHLYAQARAGATAAQVAESVMGGIPKAAYYSLGEDASQPQFVARTLARLGSRVPQDLIPWTTELLERFVAEFDESDESEEADDAGEGDERA